MNNLSPQTDSFEDYKKFIDKYISLNSIEWHLVKSKLRLVSYKKGEIIHKMGDITPYNYFINRGVVRSFTLDEKGKDYTWGIHFNDESAKMYHLFVVDYESFIKQTPSQLSYEVLEDCELVQMGYDDVQFLYGYFKKGEHFGRIMAELAYERVHTVLLERITLNAKQRFENFMERSPFLMGKIPQYHIATYLGMTPQSLSKLKKERDMKLGE